MNRLRHSLAILFLFTCACRNSPVEDPAKEPTPSDPTQAPVEQKATTAVVAVAADAKPATIGEPAPQFTLPDLDGKSVSLAEFRGRTVVLEWFNPECPFVQRSHTKGSLVDTASRLTRDGVVWLAINSGAPGKQGHGAEKNREASSRYGLTHPILLDETGEVGRVYGAAHTPHMYVIDAQGRLVYRGAIDNSPDGEGESPSDGTLVRYVEQAVSALAAGKPIAVAETQAYGCSVKYAK